MFTNSHIFVIICLTITSNEKYEILFLLLLFNKYFITHVYFYLSIQSLVCVHVI